MYTAAAAAAVVVIVDIDFHLRLHSLVCAVVLAQTEDNQQKREHFYIDALFVPLI